MNRNHNTANGIILKRTNYKEADKILTIYTDKFGKINVIAKGIRRITSKKKGHLELLNHAKLEMIENKQWYIVTQAELLDAFYKIKSDYSKVKWAYYILECFDKLIPENEENEVLYKFLLKTLKTFNDTNINPKHIVNAYNLKIIKMLGYYSSPQDLSRDQLVQNYLDYLARLKYEEVLSLHIPDEMIDLAHAVISSRTEEILEKNIKSLKSANLE